MEKDKYPLIRDSLNHWFDYLKLTQKFDYPIVSKKSMWTKQNGEKKTNGKDFNLDQSIIHVLDFIVKL